MKGTFRKYQDFNFRDETLKRIARVNAIIEEYHGALSVRQIHYQFVARDWYANTQRNYDNLVALISKGRLAGLISWTAIEDRNRYVQGVRFWDDPMTALREAKDRFKRDLWAGQDWRPEVWSEKASTEGTISEVCLDLRVNFLSLRGYNSQSEAWAAGQRFASYYREGQRPIVFHVGDHDPSGLDMTRDNRDRLAMFCGVPVMVQRLALNRDQIDRYNPPPNPAKDTDSRFDAYEEEHGSESWEVDALEPKVLQDLIRNAILQIRDETKWNERLAEEVDDIRFMDDLIESADLPDGLEEDPEQG